MMDQMKKMFGLVNKSTCEETKVKHPMEQIEADTRNLMRRCVNLSHELDEHKLETKLVTKKMLLSIIEVADDIENIIKNTDSEEYDENRQTKNIISNLQTVLKKIFRTLNEYTVVPIQVSIGEKADPNVHKVVEKIEKTGLENGTIVEEVRKGYVWNNEILRASDIKIVQNSEN